MIDPRSREQLADPFPGADGEHVLVLGPGPHAGRVGVVAHQVAHSVSGVVCRVRLSPAGELADLPASQLHFLPDQARPRDLRSVMRSPRVGPTPRYVAVPTGWGVLDRRTGHPVADHTGLTLEAAQLVADALARGEADPAEADRPA